ncbi:hypothetical protein KDA_68840 [Dictyobacter alpinus]|uniref:NACHT domain-containing protein n=1 Tax=Dictyobacter alpinus TaxID=2014873 RepID=A0A402BJ73_9CHLR|nr:NACHT domain-containing protein [Dictyobacter alpinus]GCE31400.1 hypothetical protein KDA_68840 [Dictyobacter alpinus]
MVWIIGSLCALAVIAITLIAFLVIRQQGLNTGASTLTVISLVVGMVVSIMTLLINYFQLSSANNQPASNNETSMQIETTGVNSQSPTASFQVSITPTTPLTLSSKTTLPLPEVDQENGSYIDWGEAPTAEYFYGRTHEIVMLKNWILQDNCRLIILQGQGGVGKTSLATILAHQISAQFEVVFWRSLQNPPHFRDVLTQFMQLLPQLAYKPLPPQLDAQILMFLAYLRQYRCLVVFDNFESIIQSGDSSGAYKEGYQEFGRLLEVVGTAQHQSCLLLTSREKPRETVRLEGRSSPVRALELHGIEESAAQNMLRDVDLHGDPATWQRFIALYSGNPLALKMVAEPIRELFSGDIKAFLDQEEIITGDIHELLDQQFLRLSAFEQEILYWLAIEREPVSLETLRSDSIRIQSKGELLTALRALRRRSLVESPQSAVFSLQPVIMEYVSNQLLQQIQQEFRQQEPVLLISHALLKAGTRDYIRRNQVTQLLAPLATYAHTSLGLKESEQRCKNLLQHWRSNTAQASSYGPGNILNLLIQLGVSLQGYDFSGLTIRQAYLQNVHLTNANFSNAEMLDCIFTEAFDNILCLASRPGQAEFAAGTANGHIEIWSLPAGVPQATLKGHSDWIRAIAFSPDARYLASSSDDQSIRLWDLQTNTCLKVFGGTSGKIYSVIFSPDGTQLISGGDDKQIQFWDIASGANSQTFSGHQGIIRSLALSPDGQTLISGSEDGSIRLWSLAGGKQFMVLHGHTGRVYTVAISPDGRTIASGSDDQTLRLWDMNTGKCNHVLTEHTGLVQAVAFQPDGRLLASASEDQTVRLWDMTTMRCTSVLQGHSKRIRAVIFNQDGSQVISGGEDQAIRIWDTNSRQCLKILKGHSNWIYATAFSPDGSLLASNGEELNIQLRATSSGQIIRTLQDHTSWIYAITFSPDGSLLASGSDDHSIKLWDSQTGSNLQTLNGHQGRVRTVAFSPDGSLLASGGDDQQIQIWDRQTGKIHRTLTGLDKAMRRIRSVIFIDNNTLASGSDDGHIRLWNIAHQTCQQTFQQPAGRVWLIAFDPIHQRLASGGDDRLVYLWDLASGKQLATMPGHTDRIYTLAFNPDGTQLASGSEDNTIRLWELASQSCLHILQGHTQRIRSLAFHPQQPLLASGSHDGTLKIWDSQNGTCLHSWRSDRPYERMKISAIRGLTPAQKSMLLTLGAIE